MGKVRDIEKELPRIFFFLTVGFLKESDRRCKRCWFRLDFYGEKNPKGFFKDTIEKLTKYWTGGSYLL